MGGECGMYGLEKSECRLLVGKPEGVRRVNKSIILKHVFKK
jgi:hypothetical protein